MIVLLLTGRCLAEPAPPDATGPHPLDAAIEHVARFAGASWTSHDGIVRLEGEVPAFTAREELADLAASLEGAVFVDNQLTIAHVPEDAMRDDDLALQERLRRSFAEVDELDGVVVAVNGGVVRLSGDVVDDEDREMAVETARKLDGVLIVDDDVSLVNDVRGRLEPALDDLVRWGTDAVAFLPVAALGALTFALALLVAWRLQRSQALYRWTGDRPLLQAMIGRIVAIVVGLAGLVAALQIMGLSNLASAAVGTAGVAGLAVGFAIKDIVENYLAGMLLGIQQLFSKDDAVEIDGVVGLVVQMSLRHTLLLTYDGNHVFLPNATVFKSVVTNLTRNPRRRLHFQVGVGVDEELTEVLELGIATLRAMPRVLTEPPPSIQIGALGDSNVLLDVFAWIDQRDSDFLAMRTEAIRRVKVAFDDAGFDMPEPIYRIAVSSPPSPPSGRAPSPASRDETALPLHADRTIERQAEVERARSPDDDLL